LLDIRKILKTYNNIEDLANTLTYIFQNDNIYFNAISFSESFEDVDLLSRYLAVTHNDKIIIMLDSDTKTSDLFIIELMELLAHEFIHQEQFYKIRKKFDVFEELGIEIEEEEEEEEEFELELDNYLTSHFEIEAYAYETYLKLKRGYTETLKNILVFIKEDKKAYRSFLKKLYCYSSKDDRVLMILRRLGHEELHV
jgi:hypothetical protein